jgi:hypothetical protein
MVSPKLRIQDETLLGPGTKRVSLGCVHGTTARLLLPGSAPLQRTVLRDILIAIHDAEKQCACGETLRQSAAQA